MGPFHTLLYYLLILINTHFRSKEFITFAEATQFLQKELKYPEERAMHFVKKFDKNRDGRLSLAEFRTFKTKIEET